ncbi:hypothetical protein TcCL_ESM03797, partial [Trypanosoma cruzi]
RSAVPDVFRVTTHNQASGPPIDPLEFLQVQRQHRLPPVLHQNQQPDWHTDVAHRPPKVHRIEHQRDHHQRDNVRRVISPQPPCRWVHQKPFPDAVDIFRPGRTNTKTTCAESSPNRDSTPKTQK